MSRFLLTPEGSLKTVERALALCPQITVVGVVGPGGALATNHALKSFALIHQKFPQLIKCLSTSGLLLEEKAEQIVRVGVKTVTVTVNAMYPTVLKNICAYITYNGQYMTGEYAACRLVLAQLREIEKIAGLGVMVKINTVLIPGVNEHRVEEVARVTAEVGASLINIIPLIPQNDLENCRPPDCQELNVARAAAGKYLPVFRHCKQCQADACGIPGAKMDLASELYDEPLPTFSHG